MNTQSKTRKIIVGLLLVVGLMAGTNSYAWHGWGYGGWGYGGLGFAAGLGTAAGVPKL